MPELVDIMVLEVKEKNRIEKQRIQEERRIAREQASRNYNETMRRERMEGIERLRREREERNRAYEIAEATRMANQSRSVAATNPLTPEDVTHAMQDLGIVVRNLASGSENMESVEEPLSNPSIRQDPEPIIPDTPARAAGMAALRRYGQSGPIREPEEPEEPEYICSICQEECGNNQIACGHHFHTSCLMRWMQSGRSLANTCPYCRANISPV